VPRVGEEREAAEREPRHRLDDAEADRQRERVGELAEGGAPQLGVVIVRAVGVRRIVTSSAITRAFFIARITRIARMVMRVPVLGGVVVVVRAVLHRERSQKVGGARLRRATPPLS
jgi:hypothetical protein